MIILTIMAIVLSHICVVCSKTFKLTANSYNFTNEIVTSIRVGSAGQVLNVILDFSSPFSYLLLQDSFSTRGLNVSATSSIKIFGEIKNQFPNSIFEGHLACDIFQIDDELIELPFYLIDHEPNMLDTTRSKIVRIDGVLGMQDGSKNQLSTSQILFKRTETKIISFSPKLTNEQLGIEISIGANADVLNSKKSCPKSQRSRWSCLIDKYQFTSKKLDKDMIKNKQNDEIDQLTKENFDQIWNDNLVFFDGVRNYDSTLPQYMLISYAFFLKLINEIFPCHFTTRYGDINNTYTIIFCYLPKGQSIEPVNICMNNSCLQIKLDNLIDASDEYEDVYRLCMYFDRNYAHESHFNMNIMTRLNITVALDYENGLIYYDTVEFKEPEKEISDTSSSDHTYFIIMSLLALLLIVMITYLAMKMKDQLKDKH